MISNNSIGDSGASMNRVFPVEKVEKLQLLNERTNQQHVTIHTSKEIRQAELEGQKVSVGEEQLIKAIERANKALQGINTSFEFSIHEGTKEIMVKVLDKDTGKIIREIPSEKILDFVARLWEISGILVDERR